MAATCGLQTLLDTAHNALVQKGLIELQTQQELGLSHPACMQISERSGICYGANQSWYRTVWQRRAGCGPTTGAHVMWYLAHTRADCRRLCPFDGANRQAMLRLMETMWQYITPTVRGVNRPEIFSEGIERYGKDRGVALRCETLHIPYGSQRPDAAAVSRFLSNAFAQNLPVAFLNLSNGLEKRLDSWHWVTLVDFDPLAMTATMYDQCRCTRIDIGLWLHSTTGDGAFVVAQQAAFSAARPTM